MNALLKVEATKCEVCNVQRALPKEDLPGSDVLASSDSSDIPLVNSEVIKVKLLLLFFASLLFYYQVLRESSNVFSLMYRGHFALELLVPEISNNLNGRK